MNDKVIVAIKEYVYDLFEPSRNWPEYEFRKRSYKRWAANEILKSIQNEPNRMPMDVVKEFVCKTELYSKIEHGNREDSFIFHVAHDVATDILDILKAMC